jgi:hypothetical protein
VVAEDFERTRPILRANDEGLLAHVGPDLQCGEFEFLPELDYRAISLPWRTIRTMV